jgi:hypothetical protein
MSRRTEQVQPVVLRLHELRPGGRARYSPNDPSHAQPCKFHPSDLAALGHLLYSVAASVWTSCMERPNPYQTMVDGFREQKKFPVSVRLLYVIRRRDTPHSRGKYVTVLPESFPAVSRLVESTIKGSYLGEGQFPGPTTLHMLPLGGGRFADPAPIHRDTSVRVPCCSSPSSRCMPEFFDE